MKKYFTLCLILLAFGATAQAQLLPSFGAKAGINIANVWDSEGEDFEADAKLGFAGGVFLGIPIGKVFGLQPEVLFSQKGFQGSGTLLGTSYSFSRTTSYIDVPLQLQVKPIKFITLLVGPQYSFLVHRKDVFTGGGMNVVQEQEFHNENIRKNIFGIVTGADISVLHFVFAGRFGWDLLNNNGDGSSTTPRYKNRWIQLTAGFKI